MFVLTQTVSTHSNQVNPFSSLDDVYLAYEKTVEGKSDRLLTTSSDVRKKAQAGLNEIKTVLDFQERINPLVRELIKGRGYKPEDQFNSFKQLFKEGNQTEISRLETIAKQITDWVGFRFAAQKDQLGLEFFTEWTHTAARTIDNVNAFFYAKHLASADVCAHYLNSDGSSAQYLLSSNSSWEHFRQTEDYQKTAAFRHTIETITKPSESAHIQPDEEGMAISTAFQDFRRKNAAPLSELLVEVGNAEVEQFLADKLGFVKEKYAAMKNVLGSFSSVEEAYRQFKAGKAPAMEAANNIRREIGGTGFLIALQQAFKTGFISKTFYVAQQQMITDLVKDCNEMDRCNFEINLGYGKYEGDAIPSPYAFFERLSQSAQV